MSGQSEEKYIINPNYVFREVDEELILIPVCEQAMIAPGVITISETTAFLWQNMNKSQTISQLCKLLCSEYDVDEETARQDISEMIDSMCKLNIIRKL